MKRKLAEKLQKIATYLEQVIKTSALSYQGWLNRLKKKGASKKVIDSFKGRWKGALEHAEKNKKDARFKTKNLREEYAARVAIDKLPKKYLDEPTEHHGPEKSGPIPKKK